MKKILFISAISLLILFSAISIVSAQDDCNLWCKIKYLFTGQVDVTGNVVGIQSETCPDGMIGYWKFDEGSGTTVLDSSGNNNLGTWIGSSANHYTVGKVGNAGNFVKTNLDGVTISNEQNFDFEPNSQYTILAWINPTTINYLDYGIIFSKFEASSGRGYQFYYDYTPRLLMTKQRGHGDSQVQIHQVNLPQLGQWMHVAVSDDGSNINGGMNFYVNGIKQSNEIFYISTSPSTIANDISPAIGYLPGWSNGYTNAKIDEVAVFNRVLTDYEIQELYANSNSGIGYCGAGAPADTDQDGVPDAEDNCVDEYNPDQANADGDATGDVCDVCPSDANNLCLQGYTDGANAAPDSTTILQSAEVQVIIPPGAVAEDTSVSMQRGSVGDFEICTSTTTCFTAYNQTKYSFEPEITFLQPIEIRFSYASAPLTTYNKCLNEGCDIFWKNETSNRWVPQGADCSAEPGWCVLFTNHFSDYAIGVENCGNGVMDQFEECDDGNTVSGDGCSDVCVIEVAANTCGLGNTAGMISYWKANGDTLDYYNGNHGTWQGAAGYATGQVNQAFSFNAASNGVVAANEASFDFEKTNPFSVESYVYWNAYATTVQMITAKQYSNNLGWAFRMRSGRLQLALMDGGVSGSTIGMAVQTTTSFPAGSYYHVAATYDGSNSYTGIKLYINGAPVATQIATNGAISLAGSALNNVPLSIGARADLATIGNVFNGNVDEVAVYNRVLTEAEILEHYSDGQYCQMSGAYCGDGTCNGAETVSNCPSDCNTCGDGVKYGTEQCDNGILNGQICTPNYKSLPPPNTCTYCSSSCTNIIVQGPYCGDALINGPEICDNWNIGTATCESVMGAGYTGIISCNANCNGYDTSQCMPPCVSNVLINSPSYFDAISNITCTGGNCIAKNDIHFCDGAGVNIQYDNIVLDCKNYNLLGNGGSGVRIISQSGALVKNCRISGFSTGINLNLASSSIAQNNIINNAGMIGISVSGTTNSIIKENTILGALQAIHLIDSSSNNITNNTISSISQRNIFLQSGNNNLIADNKITGGLSGIVLGLAPSYAINNIIARNTVNNVAQDGIIVGAGSTGNKIYYNSLINSGWENAKDDDSINQWHDGICAGNYYTDNVNCGLLNEFGMCSNSYAIAGTANNIDIYPLASQWPNGYDLNNNGKADCLECRDLDGDGYKGTGEMCDYSSPTFDCNDQDSLIYPGAIERCNYQDDNCNAQIDEGFIKSEIMIRDPNFNDGNVSCTAGSCTVLKDLYFCDSRGIDVDYNNIVLNCNNKKLVESGTTGTSGVRLPGSGRSGITVKNCDISGFDAGIVLASAQNSIIMNNIINNIRHIGVVIGEGSMNNIIKENSVSGSGDIGVHFIDSTYNNLTGNTITGNGLNNIVVQSSSSNIIENNAVDGIGIIRYGISIGYGSANNFIRMNTVKNHIQDGIIIGVNSGTGNKLYYNNILNSGWENARDDSGGNVWNDGICAGNYYDDFIGGVYSIAGTIGTSDNYALLAQWPNGYDLNNNGKADCAEDNMPPVVTLLGVPTSWRNYAASITIVCTDNKGCVSVKYGLSDTVLCTATNVYSSPINVPVIKYLCYEAKDAAGNSASGIEYVDYFDNDAPITTPLVVSGGICQ